MKKSEKLKETIIKYNDIVEKNGEDIRDLIMQAYSLEKPLSGIEIYEEELKRVESFINDMSDFFFVEVYRDEENGEEEFNGEIFLSRFKTLVEVAVEFDHLSDNFADLAGILFGYSPKEVYEYCQEQKNRKNNGEINKNLIR